MPVLLYKINKQLLVPFFQKNIELDFETLANYYTFVTS
jgi:hypothetical protein